MRQSAYSVCVWHCVSSSFHPSPICFHVLHPQPFDRADAQRAWGPAPRPELAAMRALIVCLSALQAARKQNARGELGQDEEQSKSDGHLFGHLGDEKSIQQPSFRPTFFSKKRGSKIGRIPMKFHYIHPPEGPPTRPPDFSLLSLTKNFRPRPFWTPGFRHDDVGRLRRRAASRRRRRRQAASRGAGGARG